MNWQKWYILLMTLILAAYFYADNRRPPELDWRQTLSRRDKIPYGTYIFYEQLGAFSGKPVQELRVPVYDHVNNRTDNGELYVLIAGEIAAGRADTDELLAFISRGNTVFIAADKLSENLSDTLGISIVPYRVRLKASDSISLNFTNPAFRVPAGYTMLSNTVDGHFRRFDTAHAVILGENSDGQANFLYMPVGKGRLYVHAAPVAFSNYFLLKANNVEYLEKVLSLLPSGYTWIYWDEYYKLGRGGPSTPLRVVLSKPDLRLAWFTLLAGVLLFVVFQSRRRQRIIPVMKSPGNATLDFVETVSRVYYNEKNHRNIALKKVTYLLDHIRTRFGLATQHLDDAFEARLVQKSGMDPESIARLVQTIRYVRNGGTVNGNELLDLSRQIDLFYKQAIV